MIENQGQNMPPSEIYLEKSQLTVETLAIIFENLLMPSFNKMTYRN